MHVRPSEKAVKQGDVKESVGVNKVVKRGRLRGVKIIIRFILRAPDEVEIAHDRKRSADRCDDGGKRVKEVGLEGMITGTIDVDDGEAKVIEMK